MIIESIFKDWCATELRSYGFQVTNFESQSESCEKVCLTIEHLHWVASFTGWGEAQSTEWLVMDVRTGDTVTCRDEKFRTLDEFLDLLKQAVFDFAALVRT